MRQPLNPGYDLVLKSGKSCVTITIKEVIGEGGCCIAYKGDLQMSTPIPVVLKECFPLSISLDRATDGCTIIPHDKDDISTINKFDRYKANFKHGIMTYLTVNQYNETNDFFVHGEKNNTVYSYSLFTKGDVLTEYVNGRILSIAEIAKLIISLCRSIYPYHANNFLYLDCKPDNIFITVNTQSEPEAHVIDFDSVIPMEGKSINSPRSYSRGWAAPEQMLLDAKLSYETDIFSIGAVFFWCLTGRKPYEVPENAVDVHNIDFSILSQIQDGSFDWRANSKVCNLADEELIRIIQSIAKNTLVFEQEKRLFDIKELISQLSKLAREAEESYSALNNNVLLPDLVNRFKYNSNSTRFLGREEELKILSDMCASDDYFRWIGICGSGGLGKSRLAYDFCFRMQKQFWLVFPPRHYTDDLKDIISNQKNNVLICLDYVKQDMQNIIRFIKTKIIESSVKKYKIRLILIEREKDSFEISDPDINLLSYHEPLCLPLLNDVQIRSLVIDYIIKQQSDKEISNDDLDLIINTLGQVDKKYRRPIYALFIADAWINNENLKKWDRDSALNYLLGRELIRLESYIDPAQILDETEQEKYRNAIKYLYALATYLGSINIKDYNSQLTEHFGIDSDDPKLISRLEKFGILSNSDQINGWEPDIIGEYYCIRYLDSVYARKGIEGVKDFFRLVINENLPVYIRYSEMIYNDFSDILDNCAWSPAMREVIIPKKYIYVEKNLFDGCCFLQNITFTGRVHTFGAYSFRKCVNLKKLILPSSLEIIEQYAFSGCSGLSSIIPEDGAGRTPSVIRIDSYAFENCTNLKDIIIPESVQAIGKAVFAGCNSLISIQIPRKITDLEESTFSGCSSLDNVYFSSDLSIASFCFDGCKKLHKINWSNICSIGNGAFRDCSSLTDFVMGKKLNQLNNYAFAGCTSLKSVDLSRSSINIIPSSLFSDCKSLSKVILPTTIEYIGSSGFANCSNLKTIDIKEGLRKIGYRAFSGCCQLEFLSLPYSLEVISEFAFENCSSLSGIGFKSSPRVIEAQVFVGCSALTLPKIRGLIISQNTWFSGFVFSSFSEADFLFVKSISTKNIIEIPDTVISIGDKCFCGNENIVSVTIPSSVKSIGGEAFKDCVNLQSIHIKGDTVRLIGEGAFSGCTSLERIDGQLEINYISNCAFQNCHSLKSIDIVTEIKSIGEMAFWGCTNLEHIGIKLQKAPKSIGHGAFYGCAKMPYPVKTDFFDGRNIKADKYNFEGFTFKSISRNELSFLETYQDNEEMIIPESCLSISGVKFSNIKNLKTVIVPKSISILPYAIFKDCTSLEKIVLPTTIKKIPNKAFMNCHQLKHIVFDGYESNVVPDGTTISPGAFSGCSNLRSIILPSDLSSIGSFTFCDCSSLVSITLPSSLEELGANAFSGCKSLTTVFNLENTKITMIKNNTFNNCNSLESVALPNSLIKILAHAFTYCHKLKVPVTFIPDSVTFIGDAAFQECSEIEQICLPSQITNIADYTFKECNSLREIIIPNCVENIGQSAFYNCSHLFIRENGLPSNLSSMGMCAFAYCESLVSIKIPIGVQILPNDLFKGCSSLERVILPDSISIIPNDCFKDCISLIDINIPSNLNTISVGAFRNCSSLTSDYLYFPESLTHIYHSAFRYCDSIETITIPAGITLIPSGTFEGCTNLKDVKFVHHLSIIGQFAFFECVNLRHFPFELVDEKIADAAFGYCTSLENPIFSDSLQSIGSAAFRGCKSITEIKLPSSLNVVNGAAFRENTKLESVVLPDSIVMIKKSAFRDCINLSNVEIKSTCLDLGERVFKGCENLYYFPIKNITSAYPDSFEDCPIQSRLADNTSIIWLSDRAPKEDQVFDYEILEDSHEILIRHYLNPSTSEIVVPEKIDGYDVTRIGDNCFRNLIEVKQISLPKTIVSIGEYAFAFCYSLKSVNIPENVTRIGKYAFRECHNLNNIQLSESITEISEGLFMYCWNLASVKIPENLQRIKSNAFLSCTDLELDITTRDLELEQGAFAKCNRNKIKVANTSGQHLWESTDSLHDNQTEDNTPFSYNKTEEGIVLLGVKGAHLSITLVPSEIDGIKVVGIGDNCFSNSSVIEEVILPGTLRTIGDYAFAFCKNLRTIVIPPSVNYIGKCAFKNCIRLSTIELSNSINELYEESFMSCICLESIKLPAKLKSIGRSCFEEDYALTELSLPDSIVYIGENAFTLCKTLKSIVIPENVKNIGNYAFKDCHSITEVILPEAVHEIPRGAFQYCWNLATVRLPSTLRKIKNTAFLNCPEVTLDIPSSVTQIETGAFAKCDRNKIHFSTATINEEWFK